MESIDIDDSSNSIAPDVGTSKSFALNADAVESLVLDAESSNSIARATSTRRSSNSITFRGDGGSW